MCNKCDHRAVCGKYLATGGVKKCEHFKEERRGRWIGYEFDKFVGLNDYGMEISKTCRYFQCDKCRTKTVIRSNYCPNCGADMRGAQDG